MRAYVNTPGKSAPISLVDLPEIEPLSNEAVISVRAFSLNRGELALMAHRPGGWRPGQDIAGVVEREAANGEGPKPGTKVAGLVEGGGWAERVAVPVSRLCTVPDPVSFEVAAALPLVGLTALRMLRLGGSLLGRRILVTGASGGVGHLLVQLASHAGSRVTAIGKPADTDLLQKWGASDVVEAIQTADDRFDLIFESVGGASLEAAVKHIAPGGTIVSFGNSSGTKASFDIMDFIGAENAKVQTYFSYASGPEEMIAIDLALLLDLVGRRTLLPSIGQTADWTRLPECLEALSARSVRGKIVLLVSR